uniref:Retrotransposon protein n=1 Tax=Cucumis melo TaxID=3656 RepID=A0A9I9E7N4_CUCME
MTCIYTMNNSRISTDENRQHRGDGCYVSPSASARYEEPRDTMGVYTNVFAYGRICLTTNPTIGSNVPSESEGVEPKDGVDMEFPTMYSYGMNMSLENIIGAQLDVIDEAMDRVNDQLRAIAEWSKVTRHEEDVVRQEVIRQLQATLSSV